MGRRAFEAFLVLAGTAANAGAAVVDVHAHETDLRGRRSGLPRDTRRGAGLGGPRRLRAGFDAQVAAAGLPPVDASTCRDFELFRGRLGRRTADEVSGFGWSADPAPYLDTFFLFGPTDHPVGL